MNSYEKKIGIKLFTVVFITIINSGLCLRILNKNYPQIDLQFLHFIQQQRHLILDLIFSMTYQISTAEITGLIVASILFF